MEMDCMLLLTEQLNLLSSYQWSFDPVDLHLGIFYFGGGSSCLYCGLAIVVIDFSSMDIIAMEVIIGLEHICLFVVIHLSLALLSTLPFVIIGLVTCVAECVAAFSKAV